MLLQKPQIFRNLLALIQTTDAADLDTRALGLMHAWLTALKTSLRRHLLPELRRARPPPPRKNKNHNLPTGLDAPSAVGWRGRVGGAVEGVVGGDKGGEGESMWYPGWIDAGMCCASQHYISSCPLPA